MSCEKRATQCTPARNRAHLSSGKVMTKSVRVPSHSHQQMISVSAWEGIYPLFSDLEIKGLVEVRGTSRWGSHRACGSVKPGLFPLSPATFQKIPSVTNPAALDGRSSKKSDISRPLPVILCNSASSLGPAAPAAQHCGFSSCGFSVSRQLSSLHPAPRDDSGISRLTWEAWGPWGAGAADCLPSPPLHSGAGLGDVQELVGLAEGKQELPKESTWMPEF